MSNQSLAKPDWNARTEPLRPERIVYPDSPRLQRIRFMCNLLDQCFTLPGGMRIGIDPIIGLLPGLGDLVAAALSLYIIYEAARLGLRKRTLLRMIVNVAIESLIGTFPVLGDIFDAVWKANMRNLRLIELHYSPGIPERPAGQIGGWIFGTIAIFLIVYGAIVVLFLKAILSLLGF